MAPVFFGLPLRAHQTLRRPIHEERSMRLKDKVAIVTGGGSGFGEGICRRFAEEGAKVVVNDINVEGGERVAKAIAASGGRATFVKADVSKDADWASLVRATIDAYGELNVVVNNAGT